MKIDYLLEDTREQLEEVKKNIKKSINIEKSWSNQEKDLEMLKKFPEMFDYIKSMFVKDTHYETGTLKVKKCVRNAFKDVKYMKKLSKYLKMRSLKKNDSVEDTINFQCYEGLIEDLDVLEDIFDLIFEALPVIHEDIENKTYISFSLLCNIIALVSRLSQLYNIYGFYLEDINGLAEYTVNWNMFGAMIKILGDINDELEKMEVV